MALTGLAVLLALAAPATPEAQDQERLKGIPEGLLNFVLAQRGEPLLHITSPDGTRVSGELENLSALLALAGPKTPQEEKPVVVPATPEAREHERLKGVTEVDILIGETDANDTRCGISEGLLNAAATKALLENGIGINNETDFDTPDLVLNLATLYFESQGLCVTHFDVWLASYTFTTSPHNPTTPIFGRFGLAERMGILSSGRSAHGQRVKDAVFDFVEEIALATRVANR